MLVSPDVIGMIIALFAFTVTVLGGVAGLLARQSRQLEARFEVRFEKIDLRFDKVDERFEKVDARFQGLESQLSDLKLSIARLEGPLPRLQRL
jgi:TolA-binding protein